MDKETFKKTEGKLYRYYENKKILLSLNEKIARLEKHKESIEEDIRYTDVKVEPYQPGSGIGERVQTSNNGTSYVEKEIIKEIDRLERERVKIIRCILKTKAKKRSLENNIGNMDFNINMLNEESKRFLELKYSDKEKAVAISLKMNMALATVYRIREEIIKDVANFMDFSNK